MPVLSRIVECEAPYSFFFNMIEPFWKTASRDSSPLHRLATLARKQGARALVIEDASRLDHVREEISSIDLSSGGGGAAEATLFSFLTEVPENEDITSIGDKALIGQCTVINYRRRDAGSFDTTFVHEAVFATPSLRSGEPLLNNFINCHADFEVSVLGRQFRVEGLYYAQQNGITSVCAHACIKMVARTLDAGRNAPSTDRINSIVGGEAPEDGMFVDQIRDGLAALTGCEVRIVDCQGVTPAEYVSVLTSAADSGDLALLVFQTKPNAGRDPAAEPRDSQVTNHVVVIYGYTRNSDEWHPQALPEYSGGPDATHSPASAWVDHFIIHDDNFGPYLTLSSHAIEANKEVRAEKIVIVRRLSTTLEAHTAEAAAAMIMSQATQLFADDARDNKWLNYLLRYSRPLVMRPILLTREEYCDHILTTECHDGSRLDDDAVRPLRDHLPDVLWMVEFTLPDLFTGNHSKLGEVLLDGGGGAASSFTTDLISGIRVPSRFLLAQNGEARDIGAFLQPKGGNARKMRSFGLLGHSPLYERNPPASQW
ncbi:MAG: hypothetical protein EOP66_00150 [Sphingomonas sp.]|nr:MAG: hypothetical protein EOP66_00150 [Sphingomonas sp.]